MEALTKEIREQLIDLIGEGAWQYAYYNFDLKNLIRASEDVHQLAEMLQDLIEADLHAKEQEGSPLPGFE